MLNLLVLFVYSQVLYVLQLFQDPTEGRAHVTSISEFLLVQPMLSFAVVDAGKCKIKAATDDGDDGEEFNSGRSMLRKENVQDIPNKMTP